MWYEMGVKMALEGDEQPPEQGGSIADYALPAAGWGATAGSLFGPERWEQAANWATKGVGLPALGGVGKAVARRLPMGLSIAANIPGAIAERDAGSDIPMTEAEGATPEEAAYQQRRVAGDQQAWQALPKGYESNNNMGAVQGLMTAPFMIAPPTALATLAGEVPGYIAGNSRLAQGDPRAHYYNPDYLHYMFAKTAPTDPNRGMFKTWWEDSLRPTGNVLRQAITKPGQTIASGAGIIYNDAKNVFNDVKGMMGFKGKPQAAAPAAAPAAPAPGQAPAAPAEPPPTPYVPKEDPVVQQKVEQAGNLLKQDEPPAPTVPPPAPAAAPRMSSDYFNLGDSQPQPMPAPRQPPMPAAPAAVPPLPKPIKPPGTVKTSQERMGEYLSRKRYSRPTRLKQSSTVP